MPAEPKLRAASAHPLLGGRHRGLDVPDIVRGRIRFGLDARAPRMLVAVIERAPVFGSRLAKLDDQAALRSRGVKAVVPIDPDRFPEFPENSPKPAAGVAVLAEGTWPA